MTDSFYSTAASSCSMSRSLRLSVESRSDPDDYRWINGGSAVRLDVQKSKSASSRQRPSPGHVALSTARARMHISDMQNACVHSLTLQLRCRSAGLALICQIELHLLVPPHPTHFWRHQSVLFQSSKLSFAILSKGTFNSSNYRGGGGRGGGVHERADLKRGGLAGRRLCYASRLFNRVVICWCCCRSCLCRLVNGKLPSLWEGERSTKLKYDEERHTNIGLFLFLFFF